MLPRLHRTATIVAVLWAHLLPAADINMPDGVAIVTSQHGSIQITDTEGKKSRPKLHEPRTLSSQTIDTKKDSYIFFALSNGLGIGIGENSQVSFTTYGQEPFSAQQEGLDYEPSVSALTLEIERGTLAIMSEGLSPLSQARVLTPTGTLRIHSNNYLVQQNEIGTTITTYKGSATFYYPDGKSREYLSGPTSVRISPQSSTLGKIAQHIDIASLPESSKRFVDATVHASQRVFFKASKAGGSATPVLIVPADYFDQAPTRPYEYRE
jgi:hypothetical protein